MNAPVRSISDAGLSIIKEFEQLRLKAYLPTEDDVPTIGWGHTRGVRLSDVCTLAQAERWIREDCYDAEREVNWRVRVPINQNQFDALVSFVFNVGGANFASSTLLKKLNGADYAGASAEFPRWNKQKGKVLGGLVRRRELERVLFLKPTDTA